MPGRVKLTTQASEEHIPVDPSKKRTASTPAVTSLAKKAKTAPTPSLKKSKPSREKSGCPIPIISTQSADNYEAHFCTHPGCDKSFARPCRLEEHLRSHTGERPYKCTADLENCDKSFLRESHLKAHIKALHLKEKHLKCTVMIAPGTEDDRGVFGFKRKPSEIEIAAGGDEKGEEEEDDDEDKGQELRECGARFGTNQHLKRHMESHMKTFPHVCTEYPPCTAGFRKRGPLRRHIRSVHHNDLPWACQLQDIDNPDKPCKAAFETRGKLGGHIDTVHKRLLPTLYTCAMCIISTGDQKKVEKTQETNSSGENETGEGDPLVGDTEHDSGNPTKNNSDSVQGLESGVSTPFPIIRSVLVPDPADEKTSDPEASRVHGSMGFKTYKELRRHIIEMHPPTCKKCGFTFKNDRNLNVHIRDHHGVGADEAKQFPCQSCDAVFKRSHALKVHVGRVHKKLRPFICTYAPCNKSFGYKSQLVRHIENHHSGRKPKQRKSRKKSAKPGLIAQLTGVGYEESGRNIKCVVETCPYRFFRMYDLKSHLASSKHGFTDSQVDELIIEAEMVAEGETSGTGDEDEDEDEDVDDDDSSGSESDECENVGMGYANLWDPMSDMEIVSDMETDKGKGD